MVYEVVTTRSVWSLDADGCGDLGDGCSRLLARPEGGIDLGEGLRAHVAPCLCPLVVLAVQDRPDEAGYRSPVGEHAERSLRRRISRLSLSWGPELHTWRDTVGRPRARPGRPGHPRGGWRRRAACRRPWTGTVELGRHLVGVGLPRPCARASPPRAQRTWGPWSTGRPGSGCASAARPLRAEWPLWRRRGLGGRLR